jgi:hypothetical protein
MANKNSFSPKKYLKEKGRQLHIDRCLISDNYEEQGFTMCLIIRKQPSGKFAFGSFLVDRLCLGIKDSMSNCNFTSEQIDDLIEKMASNATVEEVSPAYFHNLIYGALDYASELGLSAPKDFYFAEYLLDEDLVDDDIDTIEMGWKGKPLYVAGPYDNKQKILSALNQSVGADGFEYIVGRF